MPNTLPISTSNFYETWHENNMLQHIRKAANTPSAALVEKAKAHLPYKQRENWFQGTGLGTGVGTQNLDFWPSDVLQPRRCPASIVCLLGHLCMTAQKVQKWQ